MAFITSKIVLYAVLRLSGDWTNDQIPSQAFALVEPSIELGFGSITVRNTPSVYWPENVNSYLESAIYDPGAVVALSSEIVESAKAIRECLIECQDQKAEVYDFVKRFMIIKRLPRLNDFTAFAYFSVLESLITHEPAAWAGDSLTRQIKTKMALLSKQLVPPLNAHSFGIKLSEQKAWTVLYQYRSCIAHGGRPDFSKQPFRDLKDIRTVLRFITTATRRLLVFALKQPDFISDLRMC